MPMRCLLILTLAFLASGQKMAAYFANWAQYHAAPYGPYTPDQLSPIIGDLDHLMYSFAYFDDSSEQMKTVEPKDPEFIQQINGMKGGMKLIVSVGGWNFNSASFSKMASTNASRAAFIRSAVAFMQEYSFDGIDFDWEFPCSPPRTDYVKFSCTNIVPHEDAGGKCPDDIDNFYFLLRELRAAAPNKYISIAGAAAKQTYKNYRLKDISNVIDMFHIMTYDFSVSDLTDATLTAPNCPLYDPGYPVSGDAASWSLNTSVMGYLQEGVPASKIMVGAALYGHTWYTPGLSPAAWQRYGVPATKQGQCCGPFKDTYGAKYGEGSQLCGTLMISEISDKLGGLDGGNVFFEKKSATNIGYASDGVWITFDNQKSFEQKARYVKDNKLAGLFVFDTSMDTIEGGQHTYRMTKAMAAVFGPMPPNPSSPTPPPNDFCTGKQPGMYCIPKQEGDFEWCPQKIVQHCPAGTKCVQQGTAIQCQ